MAMTTRAKLGISAAAVVALIGASAVLSWSRTAEAAANVPPAMLVEPGIGNREVAVLAGGCFWGVEAVYEHVNGVIGATSGFAGRQSGPVTYSNVKSSGSAEAVRIVFDPRKVSYAELLRILFAVVADPTQINRQGPDVGPQYRTAIFPQSPAQARVAKAYIAQLQKARVFPKPIATKIESGRFVEAEPYHQDFMRKNPSHPYIVVHDKPKLAALKRQFPERWRG
jgi:peptide-methionine (S)-S-oxide reductase